MTAPGITLHVGLPKCASSALQAWADANRPALAAAGVDDPPVPAGLPAPKHQQMVGALRSGDLAPVERRNDRLRLRADRLNALTCEVPR